MSDESTDVDDVFHIDRDRFGAIGEHVEFGPLTRVLRPENIRLGDHLWVSYRAPS